MRTLAVFMFLAFVAACCPCRKATTTTDTTERDTAYLSHYDTASIVERDSMLMARLEQSHDKIVTDAQFSELSNAYCTSTAAIDDNGRLHHTLDTNDSATLPMRIIERERLVYDTVYRYRDRERQSNNTLIKEVKKVAWYDKVLRLVSAALFIIVLWQNRKRIIQLINLWRI